MSEKLDALVLGGTGFLGLNLIEALQAGGHQVACSRRRSSNTIFARRLKVPLVPATLEDEGSLVAAMRGRDTVFVFSGHYPRYSVDTERQVADAVAGLERALTAAQRAHIAKVIYLGSVVSVARPAEARPARESDGIAAVPGGSTYFAVKLAMEAAAERAKEAGQDVRILCPTGCMGRFDYKVGTGFFVVGMATGKLEFFVDGDINIVDAQDVARASIAAATLERAPDSRLIVGGHNVRVAELLGAMSERYAVPMPARQLSAEEGYALAEGEERRCLESGRGRPALTREMVDVIVHGQFVDDSKARQLLGHSPLPLAQTLDEAREWYAQNGYLRV